MQHPFHYKQLEWGRAHRRFAMFFPLWSSPITASCLPGNMGWLFPTFPNTSGTFRVAIWSPGSAPADYQSITETSFGPAMMYVRTIFNCTRNIQCSGTAPPPTTMHHWQLLGEPNFSLFFSSLALAGNGDCYNGTCHCDRGWSGARCSSWLLSPPTFNSSTGPVPPDQGLPQSVRLPFPISRVRVRSSTSLPLGPRWRCSTAGRAPTCATRWMGRSPNAAATASVRYAHCRNAFEWNGLYCDLWDM